MENLLAKELRDPAARRRAQEAYRAREGVNDQATQNRLGALEHGAWAESRVREQPLLGVAELLGAIPAYTLAKALRLQGGRSEPGLDELAEGYKGLGRGLGANLGDLLNAFTGSPAPVAEPGSGFPPMTQGMTDEQLRAFLLRNKDYDVPPPTGHRVTGYSSPSDILDIARGR